MLEDASHSSMQTEGNNVTIPFRIRDKVYDRSLLDQVLDTRMNLSDPLQIFSLLSGRIGRIKGEGRKAGTLILLLS